MTTGAVIFAYDNESIDYLAMAAWSATNIRRHLGIPVAVVTDIENRCGDCFDQVILQPRRTDAGSRSFADSGVVKWHNTNRMDAYKLTPWDSTLLLDADYVVASSSLSTLFDCDQDFLAHRQAFDVTGKNDFSGLNTFGDYRMPMSWATVIFFRRSTQSRLIFESMNMIRDHWRHYVNLYHAGNSVYRNDHALTIALGIANGHCLDYPSIPWDLATVMPEYQLSQAAPDHYRIDYVDSENRARWVDMQGQDFHAMGKRHLGEIVANNLS